MNTKNTHFLIVSHSNLKQHLYAIMYISQLHYMQDQS